MLTETDPTTISTLPWSSTRVGRAVATAAMLDTTTEKILEAVRAGQWYRLADNPSCTPWCTTSHRDLELAVFESFECRRPVEAGEGWQVVLTSVQLPGEGSWPCWAADSGVTTVEVRNPDGGGAVDVALVEVEALSAALREARTFAGVR